MPIDRTPEDQAPAAQANELDEAQLARAAGGLPAVQIAVDPSDPSKPSVFDPTTGVWYLRNSG